MLAKRPNEVVTKQPVDPNKELGQVDSNPQPRRLLRKPAVGRVRLKKLLKAVARKTTAVDKGGT